MKRKLYHILNRLFEILHIPYCLLTKEEVEESYQALVKRLKKEGIYRDE